MKQQYKEGDVLVIVNDQCAHGFDIGTRVVVQEVDPVVPPELVVGSTMTDGISYGVQPVDDLEHAVRWIMCSEAQRA